MPLRVGALDAIGYHARVQRRLCLLVALTALWLAPAWAGAQMPEDRGTLGFSEWDAGRVATDTTTIRTRVLYPDTAGSYPLVGVIHGASRTGANHIELARVLASRGFVVVLPDMPCGPLGCDHDANARQIAGLMEWAVTQSGMAGSRIAGLVDGTRRGLIGHSWGALSSHLRAASDPALGSLVLLDPNDDAGVGLAAASDVAAPTLQLLAQVPGACNSLWDEDAVMSAMVGPRMQLTVSRSGHCDPEDPGDFLCPLGCGAGDPATSTIFRRYAVAWTECNLVGDRASAGWFEGAGLESDRTADRVRAVESAALDSLRCAGMVLESDAGPAADAGAAADAGVAEIDGGASTSADASSDPVDAAAARVDAETPPRFDAGPGAASAGGCSCRAGARSQPPPRTLGLLALLAAALVGRARRHA